MKLLGQRRLGGAWGRPACRLQSGDELLEIIPLSERIHVRIGHQMASVAPTGPDGTGKALHCSVGVLWLSIGNMNTGHGIDAGKIVPLGRLPTVRFGQVRCLVNRLRVLTELKK